MGPPSAAYISVGEGCHKSEKPTSPTQIEIHLELTITIYTTAEQGTKYQANSSLVQLYMRKPAFYTNTKLHWVTAPATTCDNICLVSPN